MMLDLTLSTTFRPGTNLKGNVTGANWSFVLPRLELERIVCIGLPAASTLTALMRMGREVVVVCQSDAELAHAESSRKQNGLDKLNIIGETDENIRALAPAATDLIVIAGGRQLRRLSRRGPLQECCRRILKSEGLIYAETAGPAGWVVRRIATERLMRSFASVETLWLTPLMGEAHTAVPRQDVHTRRYFLDKGTYSPSIQWSRRRDSRKSAKQRYVDRGVGPSQQADDAKGQSHFTKHRRYAAAVKPAAYKLLSRCQRWEARWLKRPGRAALFERCGLLIAQKSGLLSRDPPEYLKKIADEAGVDISGCRWGLAAGGDYNSRKVLFFLFDRSSGPSAAPRIIVKLTRHPNYNARLQRERDALRLLHEGGVGEALLLPEVVFSGQHGGLEILGESAIDGVPFDSRSTFTADCPVSCNAVRALIDLSAETADPASAAPPQIADGLERLLGHFLKIYDVTPRERAFLKSQIERIRDSEQSVPLVFQHGDPGRWNVLVSSGGRPVFLDWESAEPDGMPLWDLFYFLRSYCVGAARERGTLDGVDAFFERFVHDESFSRLVFDATSSYCGRIGLPAELVPPLFYTCWMHRALKESTRLVPSRLQSGHYVSLLRRCMAERDAPSLRRLFSPHRLPANAAVDFRQPFVGKSAAYDSPGNSYDAVLKESSAE